MEVSSRRSVALLGLALLLLGVAEVVRASDLTRFPKFATPNFSLATDESKCFAVEAGSLGTPGDLFESYCSEFPYAELSNCTMVCCASEGDLGGIVKGLQITPLCPPI